MPAGKQAVTGARAGENRVIWPLFLWSAQLVVPLAIIGYLAVRSSHALAFRSWNWALLAVALLWCLTVCWPLVRSTGRNWLRDRRRELVLAWASVVIVAVISDAALTWSGVVPGLDALLSKYALHYRASVSTLGRLEPNQVLEVSGSPRIEINARGFRGPEVSVPKPAGTHRILFLGGSQVFDQYGDNWPVAAGSKLSAAGYAVDVVNAGVPSHRTADSIGKMLTDLWMLEPDMVVLCQAWNDIKYFARITPEHPYRDEFQPLETDWRVETTVWDRVFGASSIYRLGRSRVSRMVRGAEGDRRREPVESPGPWGIRQYRLNVETLCDLAVNLGAVPVLCTQPRLPTPGLAEAHRTKIGYELIGLDHDALVDAFAACDHALREVAGRKGATLIDMSAALSGRTEYFADHIHFNPEGSTAAAEFMAQRLAEVAASFGRPW